MNSDCARWISDPDREAVGDAVSDDDASFRRGPPGDMRGVRR